jgi:hypothetical protein
VTRALTERAFVALLLKRFAERGWSGGSDAAVAIARDIAADRPAVDPTARVPDDFLIRNQIGHADLRQVLASVGSVVISQTGSRAHTAYPAVTRIVEGVMREVDECTSLDRDVREDFLDLMYATIHYLRTRMDGDRSRYPFLFASAAGATLPVEDELAEDYVQWLERQDAGGRLNTEVRRVGGGRVDVLITYSTHRFVVEAKRELEDGSPSGLSRYLAQTGIYTKTDVGVAILLAYDLTPKPAGIERMADSVWVEHLDTGECIVVVRVPGNRASPSELSRKGAGV